MNGAFEHCLRNALRASGKAAGRPENRRGGREGAGKHQDMFSGRDSGAPEYVIEIARHRPRFITFRAHV